jgi:hypothetical protein
MVFLARGCSRARFYRLFLLFEEAVVVGALEADVDSPNLEIVTHEPTDQRIDEVGKIADQDG